MRQPKQQSSADATVKPPLPPPKQRPPVLLPPTLQARPDSWPQALPPTDDSPRSPLRSDFPNFSDDTDKPSSPSSKGKAFVAAEVYYSPMQSPHPINPPEAETSDGSLHANSHMINFSRAGRQEPLPSALVVDVGGRRRRNTKGAMEQIVSRSGKEAVLVRAALALRVVELILSLISFSVMATDKTQGWSGDSFYRYKEYRFCLSVNVIAFVYSAFQACDLTYNLATGKHALSYNIRYQFDFLMDQALAYLLMSASSASASRIDDWQSNWGKDAFTEKTSVSVSLSFLAFFGFALSSLVSGYNLCNYDFM